MATTKLEKIASIDEKKKQLAARRKTLVQQHKQQERKERTGRLCRRHGTLEKYMPDLAIITDEQFDTFIRKGIDTSYGRDILAKIVAKSVVAAVSDEVDFIYIDDTDGGTKPPKAGKAGT